MNTEAETPLPSGATEQKRGRGRPSRAAAETQKQKIDRLQAELKEAQEAFRAGEEKRALIVGHAALRHTRHSTEFARQLAAALRAEVKAKADRAAIRDIIGDELATEPPRGG